MIKSVSIDQDHSFIEIEFPPRDFLDQWVIVIMSRINKVEISDVSFDLERMSSEGTNWTFAVIHEPDTSP